MATPQTVDKAVSDRHDQAPFFTWLGSKIQKWLNKASIMLYKAHIFAAFLQASLNSCMRKSARLSFPSVLFHTSAYIGNHDSPWQSRTVFQWFLF